MDHVRLIKAIRGYQVYSGHYGWDTGNTPDCPVCKICQDIIGLVRDSESPSRLLRRTSEYKRDQLALRRGDPDLVTIVCNNLVEIFNAVE